MKPTIHFMEQGNKNTQHLIANSDKEFDELVQKKSRKHAQNLKGNKGEVDIEEEEDDDDEGLGKRKVQIDEEEVEGIQDVKLRASETKKRYLKFAELLEKKEKLDEYYLKIDREKHLLVS